MILTPESKAQIDAMSVYDLLHVVRFAPIGDARLQDGNGEYLMKRLAELRAQDNDAYVAASKEMGWK